MPDTSINFVDDSLQVLLQVGADFPNADIDFCVGYVTASGVLLLKRMLNTAHKTRAVVGLCVQNKVSAFQRLLESQEAALETLFEFIKTTRLEYAYQMLLLLTLLNHSDNAGFSALEQVADCFIKFYKLRTEAGLTPEKSYNSRRAIAEIPDVSRSRMRQMLKTSPFPRYERQGLLDISDDHQYFILNPALLAALTPASKQMLRAIAIKRIAEHFGEDEPGIEVMVAKAIG